MSIIQKNYDSRMYGDQESNSMLDPLMQPNGSNGHLLHTSYQNQRPEKPDKERIMSSITSMIKKQLNQGLNDILNTQKEKFD